MISLARFRCSRDRKPRALLIAACCFSLQYVMTGCDDSKRSSGWLGNEANKVDRVVIDWFDDRTEVTDADIIRKIRFLLVPSDVEPTTSESLFEIHFLRGQQVVCQVWVSENGNWGRSDPRTTIGYSRELVTFITELRRGKKR